MGGGGMPFSIPLNNPDTIESPGDLLSFCREELQLGLTMANHPFHLCGLSTIDEKGFPQSRTVVVRDIAPNLRTMRIHSDLRAPKTQQMLTNNAVSLLFYSQQQRIQIRFTGVAQVVTESAKKANHFLTSSPDAKICYGFPLPPGTTIGLPKKELLHPNVTTETISYYLADAKKQFTHTDITLTSIDCLWLNNKGHIRIKGIWTNREWDVNFAVA
jgi:pyridoxamine 5'-phosphate oxidase